MLERKYPFKPRKNKQYKNEFETFDKFKDRVFIEEVEYIDHKRTLKKFGCKQKCVDVGNSDHLGIDLYLKNKKKSYDIVFIEWKDVETHFIKQPCIYLKEVDVGCNYDKRIYTLYKKNIRFIYNQSVLNSVKKYLPSCSNINDWVLKDNELVWFSW